MGDMKTPDFDDLLAAFDIPDIDAKEAIQSSPEEENRDEVRTNAEKRGSGSPSCFPGPPASQSDPPVVSVIVKNTVRSESFEEEEKSVRGKTDNSPRSDSASHDFTTQRSPKLSADASAEPQIANGFEKSKSNIESWSQSSPLKSTLNESNKGAKPGLVQHTTDVINSLQPLLCPQDSVTAGPTSSSPHSVSPHLSPPSSDNPQSSPLPQNGSSKTGIKHVMHTDDDDSEPDLGSPLVIQESPEPVTSSPPKLKHKAKLPPNLLRSPETTPTPTKPQHKEEDGIKPSSSPSAPQPQSGQDNLPSVSSASIHEEKYPEHVIDERDSPESPPPSEMGLVVQNRSSSPAPDVNHKDLHHQEEPGEAEELKGKVAGDGEKLKEERNEEAAEFSGVAEPVSSPLRPLKVKIKMPTGSITRTVTGAAPKRTRRATRKSGLGSKPSPERQNTRSKREPSAMAMLQDAATKTKPKVSATAVSITKTAALPSVSSARLSPGAINLRSLGQKTINSGMMLPAPLPLLPPQTSSRPASIVNSTGAIISKSQTNLVEAFNKILNNKNLLPSYKPDLSAPLPAEWGISLPVQGFRCLECGDAFALEQSLAQHYDRRSLRIEVTCNHCAKRLAFFNKCSLLLHAREHKEKGLIMQCSHLVMKPVPVEQMVSQKERVAAAKAMPKPTVNIKKAEAAHSSKCPECQAQFSSKEEVAEHFQEIRPAHSTPCTDCSPPMLLPNGCSLAAHQRIHQSCSPHVCPECGETAKQTLFRTHLEEACLHFSRRIGYRCSSCLVVFGGLNSVKSHMQQVHCDMFHKCPSCPMAFKSAPSIQSHISAQHPTLAQGQPMLIYKCVTCDTVFTHKPLLHSHFDTHLTNQKVHVFKCPECTKLFSQRSSLLDHFRTHKASSVKEQLPSSPPASSSSRPSESSDGEELMHEDEKVKTGKIRRPSSWNCLSCHTRYTDQDDYINHMREQHGKKLKKFPCNKCENSFTTPSNLTRHIRDKHKATNGGLHCQFCTDGDQTFSSRVMLERHVLLTHIMDCVNQDTPMEGGDEADSSSEQDSGSVARRRRRGAVKEDPDEEPTDGVSPVKKLRSEALPESGLRCAPCGFTTEDQATFLEHIGQHRRSGSEGGGLQCLQCGACFTSTSSLSRHRFITHKVREASADSQQAVGVHPAPSPGKSRNHEDVGSLNGSAPASPSGQPDEDGALACKVCGKHFDKASDLNTHFRTHGMAFINARNAGKTT